MLQILNLIEKSDFDFLQLEAGEFKLTVSKSGAFPLDHPSSVVTERALSAKLAAKAEVKEKDSKAAGPETKARETPIKEGTLPVTASMVGTFYTTPEPGAPPFVDAGVRVDEDTTVGLIEVMKVFNAVKSGVRGVIDEVCVQNGQFVEYGQTLFLVRPEASPTAGRP